MDDFIDFDGECIYGVFMIFGFVLFLFGFIVIGCIGIGIWWVSCGCIIFVCGEGIVFMFGIWCGVFCDFVWCVLVDLNLLYFDCGLGVC